MARGACGGKCFCTSRCLSQPGKKALTAFQMDPYSPPSALLLSDAPGPGEMRRTRQGIGRDMELALGKLPAQCFQWQIWNQRRIHQEGEHALNDTSTCARFGLDMNTRGICGQMYRVPSPWGFSLAGGLITAVTCLNLSRPFDRRRRRRDSDAGSDPPRADRWSYAAPPWIYVAGGTGPEDGNQKTDRGV
ncbi:hypothetical protein DPEC_G00339760 [Dallia pectoralis]|uniref:Uncharacterized protein n=1 Tax=Dallia pectoralis TaxID=75939 RepID=A0ACC2F4Y1_DALPE|nr:hypothetical protein DPEC_G00339760 [Dallia pectoralis]